MKLRDIAVGERYIVAIPPRVDCLVAEQAVRGEVVAEVLETGLHYTVEETHGSMVHGAPLHSSHESANADGVRVRWADQEVRWAFARRTGLRRTQVPGGEGIVSARSVRYLALEPVDA